MKKKSKILCSIICFAVFVIVFSTILNTPEKEITSFVVSNQEELLEISQDYLKGDTSVKEYKNTEVDGVWGEEHSIVQFLYSAFGIAPSSKYYGFYYSSDDIPVAFQNANIPLIETNTNEWEWSDSTDNGGITKKICDNWFYYEAWF